MKRKKSAILMSLIVLLALFTFQSTYLTESVYANANTNSQAEKDTTSSYFNSEGKSLSTEEITNINELLVSLKKIEDFAVFANEISSTNNIYGNICVSKSVSALNINLAQFDENNSKNFSYIGDTTFPIQIIENSYLAPINVGPSVSVEPQSKNEIFVNGEVLKNVLVTELTAEEYTDATTKIEHVLDNFSIIGDSIKNEVDTSFYKEQNNSFTSINKLFEDNIIKEGDVVCINIDYTQLIDSEDLFSNLINNNPKATVVVNVITGSNIPSINIPKGFSNEPYELSSFVIWNFGSYTGSIDMSNEMLGIIVAPKAEILQTKGNFRGELISNIVDSNVEITQGTIHTSVQDDDLTTPSPTPTKKDVAGTPTPIPTQNDVVETSSTPIPTQDDVVETSSTPIPTQDDVVEASSTPIPTQDDVVETSSTPISTQTIESSALDSEAITPTPTSASTPNPLKSISMETIKKTNVVDTGDKTDIKKTLEILGAAALTLIIAAYAGFNNKKK